MQLFNFTLIQKVQKLMSIITAQENKGVDLDYYSSLYRVCQILFLLLARARYIELRIAYMKIVNKTRDRARRE